MSKKKANNQDTYLLNDITAMDEAEYYQARPLLAGLVIQWLESSFSLVLSMSLVQYK